MDLCDIVLRAIPETSGRLMGIRYRAAHLWGNLPEKRTVDRILQKLKWQQRIRYCRISRRWEVIER